MNAYSTYSDQELATLLKEGDAFAYTEIFNRFQPLLFLHAIKKVHNEEEAKDMVQEIFTDLWLRHTDFNPARNLAAYLYTCVRNKFVNLLQHQHIRARYVDAFKDFMVSVAVPADEGMMEKQLANIIESEINALPGKMRQVFLLSRKEEKSYKEIALELNISEETVRKQIKNSLKILRTRLGFIHYLVFLFWY